MQETFTLIHVPIPTTSQSPTLPHSESLSFPSFNDIPLSPSHPSSNSISPLLQPLAGPTLPTAECISHHHCCSSVSTHHESAEVVGVTLPTLSISSSKDNMSLGDKGSIRCRALWALQSRPNANEFSPVEIPGLSTLEIERRISELRMIIFKFHSLLSLADPKAQRASHRTLPL